MPSGTAGPSSTPGSPAETLVGVSGGSRASLSTSSMWSTSCTCMPSSTFCGPSARSFSFSRGGAFLGDGALRDVDVDVEPAVEVAGDPVLLGARAHVGHRRVCRLLHHVA